MQSWLTGCSCELIKQSQIKQAPNWLPAITKARMYTFHLAPFIYFFYPSFQPKLSFEFAASLFYCTFALMRGTVTATVYTISMLLMIKYWGIFFRMHTKVHIVKLLPSFTPVNSILLSCHFLHDEIIHLSVHMTWTLNRISQECLFNDSGLTD